MTPTPDQLLAFQSFIAGTMAISSVYLSPTDPVIALSLSVALEFVNQAISIVSDTLYNMALDNLAGDFLIQWAQDLPGQTFFANARQALGVNQFTPGVISNAHDESTGSAMVASDYAKNLNLMDLQNLKTPYGRQYMAIAMQFGSLWGMS